MAAAAAGTVRVESGDVRDRLSSLVAVGIAMEATVSRAAPLTRFGLSARAAGQTYDGHAAVLAFCAWPRPTYASSVRSRRVSAPDLPRAASGVCFFFVQVSWWSHSYVPTGHTESRQTPSAREE